MEKTRKDKTMAETPDNEVIETTPIDDERGNPENLPVVKEQNTMSLISAAIGQIKELGADGANTMVGVIERLVALQERDEIKRERVAFIEALEKFQAECPMIPRNKHVAMVKSDGTKIGKGFSHPTLAGMEKIIKPLLVKYNFTRRWTSETITEGGKQIQSVTCYIQHVQGHCESATLAGEVPATIMQLNSAQRAIANQSYLKRYTLIAALGLIIEDEDNIEEADLTTIDKNTVALIQRRIKETGTDEKRFLKFMGVEKIEDIRRIELGKANMGLSSKAERKTVDPANTIDASKLNNALGKARKLLAEIDDKKNELQIGDEWIAKHRAALETPMTVDEVNKLIIIFKDYLGE